MPNNDSQFIKRQKRVKLAFTYWIRVGEYKVTLSYTD